MRFPAFLATTITTLCILLAAVPARAEMLLGLGSTNGLSGIQFEHGSSIGSFYLLAGSYQADAGFDPDSLTAIAGYRRYASGKFDQSGYFGGVVLGDVDGAVNYTRAGAGGEAGYQWVTRHLRMEIHAALVFVGEPSGGGPATTDMEPAGILGASVSMRLP